MNDAIPYIPPKPDDKSKHRNVANELKDTEDELKNQNEECHVTSYKSQVIHEPR